MKTLITGSHAALALRNPKDLGSFSLSTAGINYEITTVSSMSKRPSFCSCVGCCKPAQLHDSISVLPHRAGRHCFSWCIQYLSPTQHIISSQAYKSPSLRDLEESLQFYSVYSENQTVVALLLPFPLRALYSFSSPVWNGLAGSSRNSDSSKALCWHIISSHFH